MKIQNKFIAHVGLGYWGKNIFRNLYELKVVNIACDSKQEIIKMLSHEFPEVNYTLSFQDVLNNSTIKAITIATPATTHYELVKKALLADKDVFVEKPLALTVKEAEELVSIAKKNKKILMVGHILQYHPAVIKLQELISAGELGKIQYIYSNRLNIGKLRTEENILWSFAPHDISLVMMLIGEEPISVSAFGGDYVSNGIYDTTLTTMEFKNKVKSHIFVSWLHPFKEQKLVVVGTKAMAVFDDMSEEKLLIYPHKIEWKDGKTPIAQKASYQVIKIPKDEPLKLELTHFIECIKARTEPKTNGDEGLRVLKILHLAESFLLNTKDINKSYNANFFVHSTACLDENIQIGKGTKIWHYSHILKDSKIGEDCIIGQNVMIGPGVTIGNRCKIQNNVSVYPGVVLEDEVFCGPSCVFTNVYNPRAFIERKHEFKPTIVKKGATIGANATIICGTTIGSYALVGAGAVVKKDVLDYEIVAGVPARHIGWACKCGVTLKFDKKTAKCGYCGNEYKLKKSGITVISE